MIKKAFLIVGALIFVSACTEEYHMRKPRFTPSNPKHARIKSGYSYRMKPSDSMQIGLEKENKVHTQVGYYKQKEQDDSKLVEVLDEDNDSIGYYKIGNPYEIEGVSYVPQNYEDFEETGIASWYGDIFHGRPTANGEIYNMESLTAAHPTLPLPSLVKVTNLRNGKAATVRVNDRGPFAKNRIIDVSEKAAEVLGFKQDGTTEVKIELLSDETEKLLKRLKNKPSNH